MAVIKAVKTLEAIENALQRDQGAAFRGFLKETVMQAGDAYSTKQEPFRSHLGFSLLGRECRRELWYTFHWVTQTVLSGRMIRLFNRGHLEEARFIAILLSIGCKIWHLDENGKQFRVTGYKGHAGGSLDSVILGCPDMPDTPILGEYKTHGEKSFCALVENGVQLSKWEHYIQQQMYMDGYNLPASLYLAVNKNTDELYAEIIMADANHAKTFKEKAITIVDASDPPPRINKNPGYYKCKFCDHSGICHGTDQPDRNCRTCWHAVPRENGEWFCTHPVADAAFGDSVPLTEETQLIGCEMYEVHPGIKAK